MIILLRDMLLIVLCGEVITERIYVFRAREMGQYNYVGWRSLEEKKC